MLLAPCCGLVARLRRLRCQDRRKPSMTVMMMRENHSDITCEIHLLSPQETVNHMLFFRFKGVLWAARLRPNKKLESNREDLTTVEVNLVAVARVTVINCHLRSSISTCARVQGGTHSRTCSQSLRGVSIQIDYFPYPYSFSGQLQKPPELCCWCFVLHTCDTWRASRFTFT